MTPRAPAQACPAPPPAPPCARPPAGDFGSAVFQGVLVHDMRYLASVVTQTFSACGELLAMPNRLGQISGGRGGAG